MEGKGTEVPVSLPSHVHSLPPISIPTTVVPWLWLITLHWQVIINWSPQWPLRFILQFSSVVQLCPTLWDPMNRSMPGIPVHHQLPEFTQTHVHRVSDAIQPSHPLSSPSPPTFNLSQHQCLFKWVSSLHQVAKVLELQHESFQWIFRVDFL